MRDKNLNHTTMNVKILKEVLSGLEKMTTDQFANGDDKPLRELLQKAINDELISQAVGGHMESAWDFVEIWYPDYTSSPLITRADYLQQIMEGEAEEGSCADDLELELDASGIQLKDEFNAVHEQIYREAINNFIKSTKR